MNSMLERATFEPADVMPWERADPPLWWPALKDLVIADHHLPDGTRQHMVRGHVEPGLVVSNAQVIGEANCPGAPFSPMKSHLSKSQKGRR